MLQIPGLLLILMLISSGCRSGETEKHMPLRTYSLPEIELTPLFTISDSEEVMLERVTRVDSDSLGRFYLADQGTNTVHVFDSTGSYLTSAGRSGRGPGEFESLLNMFVDDRGRLITFDITLARNTIFDEVEGSWEVQQIFSVEGSRYGIVQTGPDGEVILRQSIPPDAQPGKLWYEHELAAGHLDSGLTGDSIHRIRDQGYLLRQDNRMKPIPFGRTTLVARGRDGKLHTVWNDRFEMITYDRNLRPVDTLSIPLPGLEVDADERSEALDRAGADFRSLASEHMPETKPVVRTMAVDEDENIWLRTYDSPEYLVVDREGTPLGSFDLPGDLQLDHVRNGRLYATEVSDSGYDLHLFRVEL